MPDSKEVKGSNLVNATEGDMVEILDWYSPEEDHITLSAGNGQVYEFSLLNPEQNYYLRKVLCAAGCARSDNDPIYIMLNRIKGKMVNVNFLVPG
jgi:hypothetical protein